MVRAVMMVMASMLKATTTVRMHLMILTALKTVLMMMLIANNFLLEKAAYLRQAKSRNKLAKLQYLRLCGEVVMVELAMTSSKIL